MPEFSWRFSASVFIHKGCWSVVSSFVSVWPYVQWTALNSVTMTLRLYASVSSHFSLTSGGGVWSQGGGRGCRTVRAACVLSPAPWRSLLLNQPSRGGRGGGFAVRVVSYSTPHRSLSWFLGVRLTPWWGWAAPSSYLWPPFIAQIWLVKWDLQPLPWTQPAVSWACSGLQGGC